MLVDEQIRLPRDVEHLPRLANNLQQLFSRGRLLPSDLRRFLAQTRAYTFLEWVTAGDIYHEGLKAGDGPGVPLPRNCYSESSTLLSL